MIFDWLSGALATLDRYYTGVKAWVYNVAAVAVEEEEETPAAQPAPQAQGGVGHVFFPAPIFPPRRDYHADAIPLLVFGVVVVPRYRLAHATREGRSADVRRHAVVQHASVCRGYRPKARRSRIIEAQVEWFLHHRHAAGSSTHVAIEAPHTKAAGEHRHAVGQTERCSITALTITPTVQAKAFLRSTILRDVEDEMYMLTGNLL